MKLFISLDWLGMLVYSLCHRDFGDWTLCSRSQGIGGISTFTLFTGTGHSPAF